MTAFVLAVKGTVSRRREDGDRGLPPFPVLTVPIKDFPSECNETCAKSNVEITQTTGTDVSGPTETEQMDKIDAEIRE
jgi:hypothetical protein